MADVQLTGVEAIRRKLARIAPAVQARIVPEALRPGAEVILAEVRQRAPVLTGELRDKIVIVDGPDSSSIVSTAPHAMAIEYGKGDSIGQPHMRPALNASGKRALGVVSDGLQNLVERSAQ